MKSLRIPLLCFLLIFVSSCHFFRERGLFLNREKAFEGIRTGQSTINTGDTLNQPKDSSNIQKASDSAVAVQEESANDPEKDVIYFRVIVGSFSVGKNAEELSAKYRKLGYNTEVIKLRDNPASLLVSVFKSDDHAMAEQELQKIKSGVNKDAWLYSGKKN